MKTTKDKDENRAKEQALAQLASIREMITARRIADASGDETAREEAQEAILQDALSVEVREGWHEPGAESEPVEFSILLCTGGPAVRIVGDLGAYNDPEKARLQYQDWGTPWEDLNIYAELGAEQAQLAKTDLLAYCCQFYFGD